MRRAALLALALLLAACGTAKRSEPVAGPFEPANTAQRRGEVLFDRHCNKCHVGGEAGLGPGLNDKPLPVAAMKLQTRKGVGAMPGFPKSEISDRELDDLMKYVVALRKHRSGLSTPDADLEPARASRSRKAD